VPALFVHAELGFDLVGLGQPQEVAPIDWYLSVGVFEFFGFGEVFEGIEAEDFEEFLGRAVERQVRRSVTYWE